MGNTREVSQEEKWMQIYFEELKDAGFITEVIYQPHPLILSNSLEIPIFKVLKTKVKMNRKTILNGHLYTADFLIYWSGKNSFHADINDKTLQKVPIFFSNNNISTIEVKAMFDRANMTRLFTSRTQPWIWQKYGIFVNLTKVPEIFKNTFIPDKILDEFYYKVNTKKNKKGDKKYSWEYKTLKNYLR